MRPRALRPQLKRNPLGTHNIPGSNLRFLLALLRLRPFLWLLGLALLAVVVSFTWERWTSYDDGGIGTASFILLYTVGLPFLVPFYLLAMLRGGDTWHWWLYLGWPLGLVTGTAFYVGLDRIATRWAITRLPRTVPRAGDAGA